MLNNLAPIILFAYNRPWHTEQTLIHLFNNELANESCLYVFVDGVKENSPENVKIAQKKVLEIVKSRKWCGEVRVTAHQKNKGLALNIIDGVTEIIGKYGRAIILEDDLITSKGFLKFMNTSLDQYVNEERVMAISGYTVPNISLKKTSTFLFRSPGSWGWATWSRAWNHFNSDIDDHIKNLSKSDIRRLNIDDVYDYYNHLIQNKKGILNTWAIKWYCTIFRLDGLCLYPQKTLVRNIGFDGQGVNCSNSREQIFSNQKILTELDPKKIKTLKEDEQIVSYFKKFWWYSRWDYSSSILKPRGIGKRLTRFIIEMIENIIVT